jgi:hypothetical protein
LPGSGETEDFVSDFELCNSAGERPQDVVTWQTLTVAQAPFLRHHRTGGEGGRPMQIWLILAMVGSAPIHVGNFPDLDSCQAAAMSSRGQVTGARPGSMSYLWMCVQANTGKPNDPPPP